MRASTRSTIPAGCSSSRSVCRMASRTGAASMAWVRICTREHVVIAIDDEPRQKISFAEDDAIGVGIRDEFFAVGDGGANALRDQSRQIVDRAVRDHADRDLRRRTVERGPKKFPPRIVDADQRAGWDVIRSDNVRAINPRVAALAGGWLRAARVLRRAPRAWRRRQVFSA